RLPLLPRRPDRRPKRPARSSQDPQEGAHAAALSIACRRRSMSALARSAVVKDSLTTEMLAGGATVKESLTVQIGSSREPTAEEFSVVQISQVAPKQFVARVKPGVHNDWIPAFAGMTPFTWIGVAPSGAAI